MKNLHLFMNEAGDEGSAGSKAPDITKVLEEQFKALNDKITQLDSRVSASAQKAAKPANKEEPEEESLETLLFVDPAKAVKKITSSIEEKVLGAVNNQSSAQQQFNAKFAELQSLYPELADQKSELYSHAKELMIQSGTKDWDTGALERSVLRAAADKGIMAMSHRKRVDNDEDDTVYLGSGSSSGETNRERRRNSKADKLPAASLAFAEEVGLNVKDPKVVERLTKIHNDRRGNWNKYR